MESTLIVNQSHLLLCRWNMQQVEMRDNQQDNSFKRVILQVVATDHFTLLFPSG